MAEANIKYGSDPGLLAEIVSAFPRSIESTLNLHKNKILGSLPTSRDDFDPTSLLQKLDGGEKVLFLDSNRDLPHDWKTIDLKKSFGCDGKEPLNTENGGATDDAVTDEALTSDDALSVEGLTTDDDAEVEEDGDDAYEELTESNINLETVKNPPRVLVFTTVLLLGLLAVCKYGSVDGTFKSMTKKWKQLFVFMVDYKGTFLPVAFGWLPNKTTVSYHIFLLLVLSKFHDEKDKIGKIFGKSALKLKKIKLDFEVSIRNAFEVVFKLTGCYFHFSQAFWRRVQKGGLVVAYCQDKEFREFVRSIVAVAFLPPNQIEAAVDDLRAIEFDMNSPFIEKTSKFKDDFLDYLESTWMYGNYPVKMWNQWKQYKKLTNNNNEVYSSFFSSSWVKIIQINHF